MLKGLSAILLTGLLATNAAAQTLTFDALSTGQLGEGIVNSEAGFEFENISGGAWGIDAQGNPDKALWVGWQVAIAVGDEFSIRRADGEPFFFVSVDHRASGSESDAVDLIGLNGGVEVGSVTGLSRSELTWQTLEPGFGGPIDELRIVGASVGSAALVLDNFVFRPGTDEVFRDRFEAP